MHDHQPTAPIDILLVEDNPGDVRLTREAFKSIDHEVEFHVVTDGADVEQFIQDPEEGGANVDPDLVLLDLNLPTMDGFAVLQALDRELDFPPPPVLVLSSSCSPEDVVRSYANDANAYLTKPDTITQFDAMAQAIESFWIETAAHPPAPG